MGTDVARSLLAYLGGDAPSPNGAAGRRGRREALAARAASRFLAPERPRPAEARAFFGPVRGAGDDALLARWEGAAAAGLIPSAWAEASPFQWAFSLRPDDPDARTP